MAKRDKQEIESLDYDEPYSLDIQQAADADEAARGIGTGAGYQGSPVYEARYANTEKDPIADLDALADTVRQEREDAIYDPPNLLPSGRAEFDSAVRGEIPGYAIKDPGARAAFANARLQNPNFGKDRPREPAAPFDQGLMDEIEQDTRDTRQSYFDRGFPDNQQGRRQIAQIEAYKKAKASGKHFNLYTPEDRRRYERALDAMESPDAPADISYLFEDDDLGGFDYEGMGKRAQERQQPRSAGGMGQGPLTNPRSAAEERRLDKTFSEREEKFRDAIENADKDAAFIEIDGKRYKREKAEEILGNLEERNNRPAGPRLRGEVVRDPASRGRGGRPYRMQTGNVGSARGGGPLTQRRVKPGEAGYGGYGAPVASEGQSVTGGRTPASMMQFVDDTGNTFTTPGGGSFPNPYASSSSEFGQILADNPQSGDDIVAAAEEFGLLTDAERTEVERLSGPLPRNISQRQASQYQAQRNRKSGDLLHSIAFKVARETEKRNAVAIRREQTEARAMRSQANSDFARANKLSKIYFKYIDDQTAGTMGENEVGRLEFKPEVNETMIESMLQTLGADPRDDAMNMMTPEKYAAAAQWEADQTEMMRRGTMGGDITPSVSPPTAPVTSAEQANQEGKGYELEYHPDGTARMIDFPGIADTYSVAQVGPSDDAKLYVKWRTPEEGRRWAETFPNEAAQVAGFFVPSDPNARLSQAGLPGTYYAPYRGAYIPVGSTNDESNNDLLGEDLF